METGDGLGDVVDCSHQDDTELIDFNPQDFGEQDEFDWIDLRQQELILRKQSGSVSSLSNVSSDGNLKNTKNNQGNISRANSAGLQAAQPQHRVILHIDLDCFFVQVEQHHEPALRGRPVAVHQHQDIIAVSYEARTLGVKKHMSPDEAKAASNGAVILVPLHTDHGSKVSYRIYREASDDIISSCIKLLQQQEPHQQVLLEKSSIDEFFLDVSHLVASRMQNSSIRHHVNGSLSGSMSESLPSAAPPPTQASFLAESGSDRQHCAWPDGVVAFGTPNVLLPEEDALRHGAVIASEIRSYVLKELGYAVSAGIAPNKLLAKIASALNKPNNQSTILHSHIPTLMNSLPFRKLPRLLSRAGHRAVLDLEKTFGISTCGDLIKDEVRHSKLELISRYGEIPGDWIYTRARGMDDDPVQTRGPQKTIACSMSLTPFGPSEEHLKKILDMISSELSERLEQDFQNNNRKPSMMIFMYRNVNAKEKHCNTPISTLIRSEHAKGFDPDAGQYAPAAIASVSLQLFKQSLRENASSEPWNLRWVSICMGQFVTIQDARHSIASYFSKPPNDSDTMGQSKKRKRVDSVPLVVISDDENDEEIIAPPVNRNRGEQMHPEEPVISDDEDDIIIAPSAAKRAKTLAPAKASSFTK